MKKIILLIISSVIVFTACNKLDIAEGTPNCVKHKINGLNKNDCNTGVNVMEYTFQGETVYVLNPGNCTPDGMSEVIDSHCKSLGSLWGFAGNKIINGEDFTNATYIRTVWVK